MGRVDDKEGESLLSEAEDERGKERSTSEAEDGKDMEKSLSDLEDSEPDSKKKYKCPEPGCKARFLRPSRLTWHLRKHNDERPYKCDQEGCTRAYTNSSHLKRHLNTTHKPIMKIYKCEECDVELGSLFSLKRHNKKIHDPTRLTCKECGTKFRKKHCYNEHMSMHVGVALYKCDICKHDFPTLRLYKKHHRIHETVNYPCTLTGCTESFDKWSKLSKHMETAHEFGTKCDKCDKKFRRKRDLDHHSKVHINEGVVFTCPYENCSRFYTLERNLEEHVQSVHLGRNFTCDMCQKSFRFKSAIVRHIQVVHERVSKPPSKRRKQRRTRKDAGVCKKSIIAKLVGVDFPAHIDKRILKRKPQIHLERTFDVSTDESECENETVSHKKTSLGLEKRDEEPTPMISESVEAISSVLTGINHTTNSQDDTLTIMTNHLQESVKTGSDKNLPVSEETTPIICNEPVEESSDIAEKRKPEISMCSTNLLQSDVPVVLAENMDGVVNVIEAEGVTIESLSSTIITNDQTAPPIVIEIVSGSWS